MNSTEAYQKLVDDLGSIYEPGECKSIAKIVFEDVFDVYINGMAREMTKENMERFEEIRKRLLAQEPLQYVLGEADFYGLKLAVSPSVLIPRQETEELVDWVIKDQKNAGAISILDIGTGSGCIAVSLKKKLEEAQVMASDLSEEALVVAKKNARSYGLSILFFENDILDNRYWPRIGMFDVIVSNPPYIPHEEKELMRENVLNNEPHLALFVEEGKDLIFYDKIAEFGKQNLKKNGAIYFELNENLATETLELMKEKGYENIELRKDINGKDRMLKIIKTSD